MKPTEKIAKAYSHKSLTIIMLGQSNMAGRDVNGTNLTSDVNDDFIYEYRESDTRRKTFSTMYGSSNFGPDVGLMRTLYANGERDMHCLRHYAGGHSLPNFIPESKRLIDPQDDLPGGIDQSALCLERFNAYMRDMLNRHFQYPDNIHFVWFQGAEDSKWNGEQVEYTQDLSGLYRDHLPILVNHIKGGLEYGDGVKKVVIIRSPDWNANTPGSKPYQDIVRSAQEDYANSTPNTEWITSDINQGVAVTWEDSSHIDAFAQERLGMDLEPLINN